MTTESDQAGVVYQLKITLACVDPPIWRRVQVPDCSLAVLHDVIQGSMGWEDCHLHVFEVGRSHYSCQPSPHDPHEQNASSAKLGHLVEQGFKTFSYTYDFGDNWEHRIEIEKTLASEEGVHYPRCVDGERACPPEDCGGSWGYQRMLEVVRDPAHVEYEEMIEWVGEEFDPEGFDPDALNERWSRWDLDAEVDDDEGFEEGGFLDDYDGDEFDDKEAESDGKPVPFVRETRVGRNDRCPCGSGKKFKKCCLNKQDARSLLD